MDAYQILGLDSGADGAAIRSAYLKLIKTHTPEQDPEAFARIRRAFEELNDPMQRMRERLFGTGAMEKLIRFADTSESTPRRMAAGVILDLGRTYDRTA